MENLRLLFPFPINAKKVSQVDKARYRFKGNDATYPFDCQENGLFEIWVDVPKIHIAGTSGSGKTYIAERVCDTNTGGCDLDTIISNKGKTTQIDIRRSIYCPCMQRGTCCANQYRVRIL